MPRLRPDHRAAYAIHAANRPEHVLEAGLWCLVRGLPSDAAVERAAELDQARTRDCLRGWLLATSKDDEISRRTRVPEAVIKAYRHLFFDVTVFRDHFDLVDWARQMEAEGASAEAIQYVRWAIMYGVEAVAYMSGLPVNLDPSVVQSQAMADGHFKALLGRETGLDSAVARESLKHQQMAVAQAAVLAKKSPGTGGWAIRLKHREMTSPIEVVDMTTEVLH